MKSEGNARSNRFGRLGKAAGVCGVVALLLIPSIDAWADDQAIEIDGQVRVRTEVDGKSFHPDDGTQQFTDLRTRVGLKAGLKGNGHAYVQVQDSRRFGGVNQSGALTSGSLAGGSNVDVHQAYVHLDKFFADGWGLRAGRFEVNLGNQRVFGGVGWHNVGRSWEGIHTFYTLEKARLDGMWLKAAERNNPEENRDFDAMAVQASFPEPGVEAFVVFENEANEVPNGASGFTRISLGGHAKRQYDRLDAETNLVFQMGSQDFNSTKGDVTTTTDADISAFLLTLEVGTKVGETGRVAAGIDYASGDDEADDKIKTYNNLYYTGHKFRGAMDYFLGSNTAGLMDLMLRGSVVPADGWKLLGDFHFFQTAAEYVDFDDNKTTDVGMELDLAASTSKVTGATVVLGTSVFLPTEAFAGMEDPDPGYWLFAMVTAGF